ncbi:MAG: hypothetical protein HQP61_02015 [Peptococcaceae bacterium]|nr:hypothetical protein [Candidatus Syntrophopropionicum ammoniitolerans]
MTAEIRSYIENGFFLGSDELEAVVDYIYDHAEEAPVLYRGLSLENLEEGDTIPLQDMEAVVSLSPSQDYAWNFAGPGGYILVVPAGTVEGIRLTDDEWLAINEDVYIDKIEYNAKDDVYVVFCE